MKYTRTRQYWYIRDERLKLIVIFVVVSVPSTFRVTTHLSFLLFRIIIRDLSIYIVRLRSLSNRNINSTRVSIFQ